MRSVKIKEPVFSKTAPVMNELHTHFSGNTTTRKALGSELAKPPREERPGFSQEQVRCRARRPALGSEGSIAGSIPTRNDTGWEGNQPQAGWVIETKKSFI